MWDGIGTVAIGLLLLVIATVLTVEMRSLLIGEAATSEDIAAIKGAVDSSDGVVRAIDVKTQHIGPEELLVAAKIEFDHSLSVGEVAEAIDRCEQAIRLAVPHALRIYLEPDFFNPDHVGSPDLPPDTGASH